MKKLFTKVYYVVAVIILFVGATLRANAQYTLHTTASNVWCSALTSDANGDIFAVEAVTMVGFSDYGKVVEYAANGAVSTIYNGSTDLIPFTNCDGAQNNAPQGIAVTANGDVYVTTAYDPGSSCTPWGNIIRIPCTLVNNPGVNTYGTPGVFLTGTSSMGLFETLAVDTQNNLYCYLWDVTGDGGTYFPSVDLNGSFEIEEFPASGGVPQVSGMFRINGSDALQLNVASWNSGDQFINPTGLAIDPSGNIYVADPFDEQTGAYGGKVYKLTKGTGNSYTASTFTTGQFTSALGADASGNLYAINAPGDASGNTLPLVEYVNAIAHTISSAGTINTLYTSFGDGGPEQWWPNTIAAVNSTNIYVDNGSFNPSSGTNTNNGDVDEVVGPPTAQASNISFTSTTEKTTTISWTNGGGTSRAVFVALSTAGSISLSNGTTYSPSTNFTSGTQAGSGWYCVYNGTGSTNSVGISNLTANTGYKVMVVEYNGGAGPPPFQNYDTGTGTNNPTTFTTLTAPVLTASGGTDSYSLGGTAAVVDAGITATAGQTNLNTATINVSTGFSTGDALNFTAQNGITSTFTAATGVLTLSGSSSVANYQTALRSITFSSSSASTSTRTISFLVGDGTSNSNTVTKNIAVTSSTTLNSIALVNAATNNLTSVQYTVMFAAAVGGLGTTNFTATGVSGTLSGQSVTGVSGTNPYTVTVNTGSGSGTLRLDLTSNSGLTPAVSNEPYTGGPSYTIDRTAPTVSTVTAPVPGTYGQGGTIILTVNYSEAVTVNTGGGTPFIPITLNTGGTVQAAYTSGSGTANLQFTYLVVAGNNDPDGITVGSGITANGGTLTDGVGNSANLTLNNVGSTAGVLVDGISPTVNSIVATGPSPTNTTSVSYTVTFSEAVTGVGAGDFTATTSGVSTTSITVTPISSSVYTVTVNGVNGNGTVRLDLNNGSGIFDLASNQISGGFTSGDTYTIDQTAPTVSAITATGTSPTNATSVGYTVTFSEGVTGVDNTDFTATVSGVSTSSITVTPVSSNVYTVTINGVSGNGTVRLDLNSSGTGITDLAGNAISGGFTGGDTYTIDQTAPTISSITATSASPTNATSAGYTVTFSEAVTGVDATDFTTTTSGVSATGITVTPVSNGVYTVTVNGVSGNGTLRLDLNSTGTGIADLAGNAISGGFTGGDTYTIDQTAPTVLSITRQDPNPSNATSLDYQVTFSEPVTGVDASDFTATTSGVSAGTISVTPISSAVYNIAINTVSGNGTLRLDLNNSGTGITDLAGNAISGGFTGGDTFTIDQTAPSVSSITATTPTNASPTNATSVGYTVTFSEAVTGVDPTDFTATASGVSTSGISVTPVSTSVYTVTVNSVSGNGTLRLDLNSSGTGIADLAGNAIPGGFTGGDTYTIDQTAPTASSITATGASPTNATSAGYTATFSEAVTGVDASDFTATTSGVSTSGITVTPVSSSVYTVTINGVSGNGTVRLDLNSTGTGIMDLAGNAISGGFTSGDTYAVDQTAPTATIGAPSVTQIGNSGSGSVTYTVTYADANFNTSSLTTSGITLNTTGTAAGTAAVSGSGTSYTVTISGITGLGTIGISVAGGNASDLAGNTDAGAGPSATFAVLSSDATLSSLAVNGGSLGQTFAPGTTSYTESVSNATTAIAVIPTTTDPNATITVAANGGAAAAVTSGALSANIPLAVGPNTVAIAVTAQDGISAKTYTITITRAPSNDAFLSHIAISAGTLIAVAGTTNYTASVSNATASVTVTPTTLDPNATVTVALNGGSATTVTSGMQSPGLPLNIGSNTITTIVKAQNGTTTKTYVITITRAPSNDAFLNHLVVSTGSKVAVPGTNNFTESVSNVITSVTVTPTTLDPNATVTIALNSGAPAAVISGTPSASLPLNVGANTITTVVTAQDGITTQTYIITITRAVSNDAFLSHIVVSTGSKVAVPGTNNFTESVSNVTTSVTVTPTTLDPNATVTVALNGGTAAAVTSGTPSASLPLNVGANTITTVVTAQDGITTQTYIITVTRAPSNDAFLSHIALSTGTLIAVTGTTNYTASVDNATTAVTVTPTTLDPNATVTVALNGGTAIAVTSGTPSASLSLNVGSNTITTVVTAQDGITTQTYIITITRAPSGNANLANLKISSGTLTPVFATGTTSYTVSVSNATASVTVTPFTSDPTATVNVALNGGAATAVTSGAPSASLPLNVGANNITTVVTAQNLSTKTYTVTVTRAGSNDAFLSHIAISSGTLTPVTGTTNYTASVSNATTAVKVTPTTLDPNATVTVVLNGGTAAAVTSGTASGSLPLNVGSNIITTKITAQDGVTIKIYSITVTRATGPQMSLYQPIQPVSVTKPTDTVTIENDGVMVHQGVSPNGDGINDVLTIDGINQYPDNQLSIIDRNGTLLYQAKGYDNSSKAFDGHSSINGKLLQAGTYFYSLDYNVNGQDKHKTGYILLKY